MRLVLLVLTLLAAAQLTATLDLRDRVVRLEAPPAEPTVMIPGTFPPEFLDDVIIDLPMPHDALSRPR